MTHLRFISSRIITTRRGSLSAPMVRIAVASIALGVLVMILSVCILRGFQGQITQKVVGFGSHITISTLSADFANAEPFNATIGIDQSMLTAHPNVRHIQPFATMGGMAKTDDQIHGIILKGIGADYDTTFFSQNLVEGRLVCRGNSTPSNEVVVSQTIANKLQLSVGDRLRVYYWVGDTYRARAHQIVGIYRTDLSDFDEHIVVGDLAMVQRLRGWQGDEVQGLEVLLYDFDNLDATVPDLLPFLPYDLTLQTIRDQNQALFAWLDLLNTNITLIIAIMALVCLIAITSALLIIIFENAQTIGLLKTLGATNADVRRLFMQKAAVIALKGIVIGSAVALIVSVLQQQLHIIHLDPESYSMTFVPIDLNIWIFIAIGLGSFVACLLAQLIPAALIAKVNPAQSMRIQ